MEIHFTPEGIKAVPSSHTQGPWFINGPYAGDSDLFIRTNMGGEGFDIANLNCDETGDYKANAKLIAAAPELLAALQLVLKQLDEGTGVEAGRVAEAIQKAIG